MSAFEADPRATAAAFEPRFGVRRLIAERGNVFTRGLRSGMIGSPPYGASMDSLEGTLEALDPLIVALILAGYDVREVMAGLSRGGQSSAHRQGYLRAFPRQGLGYGFTTSWSDDLHVVRSSTPARSRTSWHCGV